MTIEEISRKTGIDLNFLQQVYDSYGKMSLDQVYRNFNITQEEYDAYCYLWRNMCTRFSDELIHYELR